jgi:hypothetical protein
MDFDRILHTRFNQKPTKGIFHFMPSSVNIPNYRMDDGGLIPDKGKGFFL